MSKPTGKRSRRRKQAALRQRPRRYQSMSAKALYRQYGAGVVAVVTTTTDGDQAIGSAFHVGDGAFVTARHVVENMASAQVEIDDYRLARLAPLAWQKWLDSRQTLYPIAALFHPDAGKDVAVFTLPELADLPTIPLGGHLDDWISDHQFILNEVLVLGFPPIPLAQKNVLVASRAQISAVVDLINVKNVHFIVSAMARGGFSGGVVLSEWGVAMGVVTSSLLHNGAPAELGYLTVLTIEPILECLAAHELLPRETALQWDGLFTRKSEHFGDPKKGHAHSWIDTDRDGHRARVTFATPDDVVVARAIEAIAALENVKTRHAIVPKDVHIWEVIHDYPETAAPIETLRGILQALLLEAGYAAVTAPRVMDRTLGDTVFPVRAIEEDVGRCRD